MYGIRKGLTFFFVFLFISVMISGSQFAEGAGGRKSAGKSTITSKTVQAGTVSVSVLNVRQSYSASSKIIGVLYKGSYAYIIGSTNGWYNISFNKGTGWVYGAYLTNVHDISTPSSVMSSGTPSAVSPFPPASDPAVPSAAASSAASPQSSSAAPVPSTSSAISSGSSTSSSPASSGSQTSGISSSSSSGVSSPGKPASSLPSKIVAGYYTSWSAYSGFTPDKIKASMINIVHYAFASIGSDLKIAAGDPYIDYTNFAKLNNLKKSYPNLKTLISVGGWDGSSRFSDMALTDKTRKTFAQSCASFIRQYGFDGVDIDWEYPVSGGSPGRAEDKTNFTLLMKTLREALDAQGSADGKYYYLSFAGGASNGYIGNVQLSLIAEYVDYAVDMTYDLHGPWDSYTDLNAPLYKPAETSPQYKISVNSSIQSWLNAGFPAGKLIMGVPLYGYIYSGVSSANNGLYQTFSSAKSIGYDSIAATYLSNSLYAKYVNAAAQVPYLYGNGNFISYDDAASISAKARYSLSKGIRGMSAWELSYDKTYTLLSSIYNNLH